MWWELSGDAPEHTGRNLVRTVKEAIGGLEWRENELNYPGSSELHVCRPGWSDFSGYDNLRKKMA